MKAHHFNPVTKLIMCYSRNSGENKPRPQFVRAKLKRLIAIGLLVFGATLSALLIIDMNQNSSKFNEQVFQLQYGQVSEKNYKFESGRLFRRQQCLQKLQDETIEKFKQTVTPGFKPLVVGQLNPGFFGDNLILAAIEHIFAANSIAPIMECQYGCQIEDIQRLVNGTNCVIFIQLGPDWNFLPDAAIDYRDTIARRFSDHMVVILPYTQRLDNSLTAQKDIQSLRQLPKLVMMARDIPSYSMAKQYLLQQVNDSNRKLLIVNDTSQTNTGQNVSTATKEIQNLPIKSTETNKYHLVPDLAFSLGPQLPACQPQVDVVLLSGPFNPPLLQNDHRQIMEKLLVKNISFLQYDWGDFERIEQQTNPAFIGNPSLGLRLSNFKTMAGNKLLCKGRVILTDRLYAVILSILIDRPVVYVQSNSERISEALKTTRAVAPGACLASTMRYKSAQSINVAVTQIVNFLKVTQQNDQLNIYSRKVSDDMQNQVYERLVSQWDGRNRWSATNASLVNREL